MLIDRSITASLGKDWADLHSVWSGCLGWSAFSRAQVLYARSGGDGRGCWVAPHRGGQPSFWAWICSSVMAPGTTSCERPAVGNSSSSVSCSVVPDSATPWTAARQAPLSMGFSRQEYWSELPSPFSRGSYWPRAWTRVSYIAGRFFTIWAIGKTRKQTAASNPGPSQEVSRAMLGTTGSTVSWVASYSGDSTSRGPVRRGAASHLFSDR